MLKVGSVLRLGLVALLLVALVVPVAVVAAHNQATHDGATQTLPVQSDTAKIQPAAVIACTPGTSGSGCGGG